jgi:hypothetical protein
VTTSDGLLWSVDDVEGERLVLVIRAAADATDPGIRVPMPRETVEWLISRLTDAVAALPRQD